jgi:hypothetical protein
MRARALDGVGTQFVLDSPWPLRYTGAANDRFTARVDHEYCGKVVISMCFSAGFMHATREAFVQRQLLQCRTCGSQAFHGLDCCRNPDYVRVPTWHFGERLRRWLGSVKTTVHAWLPGLPQRPEQPLSPEALDAWEARPLGILNAGPPRAQPELGADEAMEAEAHEPAPVHR